MEVVFEKIEDYRYGLVKGSGYIEDIVLETINNISVVDSRDFNITVTEVLYECVLSRLVSGLFLKAHLEEISSMHHVLITVGINNTTYNVTLGSFGKEDALGYVNGITEV